MTHFNMDQPIFTLLMQADDGVYSPELNAEQLTDRDVLIEDIKNGQFAGTFVSLLQSERGATGKLHMWDVSSEVTDAMEEEEEDFSDYEPISVELAGIESIRRVL